MTTKVFITGASGFVGSHLVEAAKNRGWEVHAAVRSSSKIDDIKTYVDKFVHPDFGNVEELKHLFLQEQYDYIIHAAALTKSKSEEEILRVNVGMTQNLMQVAFEEGVQLKRFVYVSSLAAIGPIAYNSTEDIQEDTDYRPLTVYGRSKRTSELNIKKRFADKPISIFRPTAVYGPREKDLFILFDTLNKGLDPYIGSNPQKLSFIYVKDLVDVLLKGCEVPQFALEFYNISDGHVYSKYAMADIFRKTFKKKALRLHIPYRVVAFVARVSQMLYKNSSKTPVIYPERLGELTAENWSCDISKAKTKLGFNPQFDLEKGLTATLLWYKDNKWL
ncbi:MULTISPECIES: NAD-dependent epimerase/dehydratase family protein [Sphingobacterium]|uniref:NAD(P)-dependent oxidoreductase n=1 Tax=Sphingobacterium litopenaei TaxID=2763500 RepID=A0ABR7YAR0_9SPHI|nr:MULTISPECIES: NAD(P)-dependent oxidoreductase [Sphingobacterium]MBD1428370.1 NAD(P)-dependent oxidoreductase [Sphingobacterium litopenaei]NGM72216.1 NAD(P)-dependent oxidoreductase [Sphingobacterium sp. SGL-16]